MELPNGTIIGSGPVIIENNKVLLNREKKKFGSELFMFPGGVVDDYEIPLEDTARREVMEELGIEIEIIKPLRTLVVDRIGREGKKAILVHYLAKRIGEIKPSEETIEWNWFDIDNLPSNCAENVKQIIQDLKK